MPEELETSVEVSEQPPEGLVDSPEEYEELEAEESEEQPSLEDDEAMDQEDTAGESEQIPADNLAEQRIQELEAQMTAQNQRHNAEMQEMRNYAHQLGMQSQPPRRQEGAAVPDLDDMTPRQQADHSLQQAQQYANGVIRNAMAQVSRTQMITNQVIEAMLDKHSEKDLFITALNNMQGQHRPLDFTQSLASERGKIGTQRAAVAEKQLGKQSREQRKRADKARSQSRRPRAAATKKTAKMTIPEALEQAAAQTGGNR